MEARALEVHIERAAARQVEGQMLMDVFDLRGARYKITQLLAEQATDHRVLEALRFQDGLVPQETELWDYKARLSDNAQSRLGVILYIVSFYNTYGGYLLYGVEERDDRSAAIVGNEIAPDQQQLRDLVRAYTGASIPLTVGRAKLDPNGLEVALVCVPKRPTDEQVVEFGKNGPDAKPGKPLFLKDTTYFRDIDQSSPARTRDHWALLLGPRQNPALKTLDYQQTSTVALDHNLPDQNLIFPWFVGRNATLTDLWRWLGNSFAYLKLLVGEGGKGKTSIAYEFARQVCTSPPFELERVLWLSAKQRRFVGQIDSYVEMPETHFSDAATLLRRLASHLAITSTEVDDASETLLKQLIKEAVPHLPYLLIVDDVDSLDVEEQKTLLSVLQQLACHRGRILITTRMNFAFGPDMAIAVGGLDELDYAEYVRRTCNQFKLSIPTEQFAMLRAATDGSPLFTESLLRLVKQGLDPREAVAQWQGKLGAEARNAALMKEIRLLTEESRRILLACSLLETASTSELKGVVEYVDQRMQRCVAELQSMFLLSEPHLIEGERRYGVSRNTQTLVLEHASELCNDPVRLQRRAQELLRHRRGVKRVEGVGLAISQAVALVREKRFPEARATTMGALGTLPDNPDLLSTLGLCLLAEGQATRNRTLIEAAREELRKSYNKGQRKAKMFELWHESEAAFEHWKGAQEVSELALESRVEPRAAWLERAARANVALANEHAAAGVPSLADTLLAQAADRLMEAATTAPNAEAAGIRAVIAEVHDKQWALIRENGHGIAELKLAVDALRGFVNRGDIRRVNAVRSLEALEYLVEAVPARRGRRRAFENKARQILRESVSTMARLRAADPGAGWDAFLGRVENARLALAGSMELDE